MQPNNRSNGPVMDIQRPNTTQPPAPARPTVPQESVSASSRLGRPATMEYTRPRPGGPTQPSRFDASADQAKVHEMTKDDTPTPKKSKKGLILGVVVFLIVVLAGGAAAYYFLVMNQDQPAVVEQQPELAPEEDVNAIDATPEGVDNATNAIDQSLNSLDDNADFRSDELTDSALGI